MNGRIRGNMRLSVLLFPVFILSAQSNPKHKQRTVNVALETSLLFEPKDIRSNLGLVSNVRSFLDRIYDTLEPHAQITFRENEYPKTLPDFLNHLGSKFLKISTDGVEHVKDVLTEHVNTHSSKARSSYHEIFSDPTLKKVLKDLISEIAKMDGEKMKKKLHKFMRSDKPVLRSFTKRLNKFYTEEDLARFHKYVNKIEKYARRNKDMTNIIKEWLDFGIFDRYNKLNYTYKVKLLNDMTLVRDYINGKTNFRAEDEPIKEKSGKIEDVSGSEGEDVHLHHRHSNVDYSNKHKHNKTGTKDKDKKKTEVILDNVEFYIKTDD